MVKTYILAPNWTTAPPPDGPIKLGHLLGDLTEFVPVNRKEAIDIPVDLINKIDTKDGFKSSRSRLVSGELGLFAKVVGLFGIGAGAGIYYNKDTNDVLSCSTLDTMTFDPTPAYILNSLNLPEVTVYMKGCRFKQPLYMVTGLKVARGGSLESSASQNRGVKLHGGLNPPGTPVGVDGNMSMTRGESEEESWEGSTDFIVAFRVRKIWYHKGEVKNKAHNKNVIMQDGSRTQGMPEMCLEASDEVGQDDVSMDAGLTRQKEVENGEEVEWIVPTTN